ncbi:hypothetical protein JKP88DRAFT_220709 [Tribonema minus]|uniref:Ubiquitin-like domain-containing protein n=1 Tax=Tribonema minus TaxID=303371 RepID=A0A835YWG3_9STRA|nr:hypothetical protein JKP88DRAFT_220709 [Tribonema minus]|eukprot:TRINITY_DN748_c0_g1_i1.p2 TRINITY_DN748_c0_g1~~TRINITY_DN748_c0_g1_i1.p2  ORF type:complete len:102 (-),score=15.70 TRINITY_DN748_c0_g1_i1:94-399(-)
MSMYVRLKRKSTTIFLHVEPSDNFQSIKQRAAPLLKTEPGQIGLFTSEDKARELVDLATVGDQEILNDQVLYMVLRKGGDSYEDVEIPMYTEYGGDEKEGR